MEAGKNIMAFVAVVPLVISFLPGGVYAQEGASRPVEAVPTVDLVRYAGTWYEIARLPNRFQKECVSDVTATYSLLGDGQILVVNRCRTASGEMKEAEGKARRKGEDAPTSKLQVRFAPAILSFLPLCGRTTGSLIWPRTTVTPWWGGLRVSTSGFWHARPSWPERRTRGSHDG